MSTIKLKGSSSGEAEVTVAAAAGTPTFTLPTTVGSANQLLKNSGTAGTLGFSTLVEDSSGNVGINEASPQEKLHVGAGGKIRFERSDGARFGELFNDNSFVELGASTDPIRLNAQGYIRFDIASSEKARIMSGGQVLIGKTTTSQTTGEGIVLQANANVSYAGSGTSDHDFAEFYRGTSGSYSRVGYIRTNGSSTTYSTSSDYRLKENEVAISDGITRLKLLKPYKFNFKVLPDTKVDGFFAHEVTPVVPEAITGEKNGTEMQGIDQSKLVPLLTAALQEAITKIETLETKVAALEAA